MIVTRKGLWTRLLLATGMVSALGVGGRLALAVEATSVIAQYSLVGVISEDSADGKSQGIAVLKDRKNRRTLTLKTGDRLPYSDKTVHSIKRREVMIREGESLVAITHDGSVGFNDESEEKKKPTASAEPFAGFDEAMARQIEERVLEADQQNRDAAWTIEKARQELRELVDPFPLPERIGFVEGETDTEATSDGAPVMDSTLVCDESGCFDETTPDDTYGLPGVVPPFEDELSSGLDSE